MVTWCLLDYTQISLISNTLGTYFSYSKGHSVWPLQNKTKMTIILLGYVNYRNIGAFTWILSKGTELASRILLPLRSWRDFLVTPSACEDSWIAHTRSHNKRERSSQKEKVHTHYPSLTFSLLSGPVRRGCRKETSQKKTTRLLTNNSLYCLMSRLLLNLYTLPTTLPSRGLPLVQFERFRVTSGKPSFWLSMLKGLW